jgi:GT2 family glycosyltransferase
MVEVQRMDERLYQHDVIGSIVAYRSDPTELERAIRSFLHTSLRVRMLVVDNSPTEALGPMCRRLGTEYLFTGSNCGFGAGHNIALRNTSSAKYHLALNPDVQFEANTLEELVEFLELNETVGLVMPRVFYPDGSPQRLCKRLPAPFDILARRTFPAPLKRLCHRQLALFELSNINTNTVLSVPHLSGCFMLMRRQALMECGLFDERFFLYFEDVDLTRRIHERYETVYYPHVKITHRHEKGSYKSLRLLFYGIRSAVRYFNKWGWVWDEQRDLANSVIGPRLNLSLPARFNL